MTEEQLSNLCKSMTLVEKTDMLHGNELFRTKGIERLGIPPMTFSDGPMGVRTDYEASKWFPIDNNIGKASYLPSNTALAATFNRELSRKAGESLGKEARGRGKDMILAPGINIQRTPLCGRNFEYMGEDPFLTREMTVPLIQGIESNDVSCCVKHFALNNQETERLSVNVEADERTLQEIYLPAFKAAIKEAHAKSIMGAYNKFRGQHCCHNDYLLNQILRKEWGFEGVVVSDWGGVHDTIEASENGLDIEMSVTDNFDDYYFAKPLLRAVEEGKVKEEQINEKVMRVLRLMNSLHMLDGERKSGQYNDYHDYETYLQIARESVVLLKNENQTLPLTRKAGMRILVVGDNADKLQSSGGGSAEIKALYELTPLMGITMLAGGNVKVTYERGYNSFTSGNIWDDEHKQKEENWQATSLEDITSGSKSADGLNARQKQLNQRSAERAVEAAKTADLVIFVGGLSHEQDTEGKDRTDMILPYGQDELIHQLLDVNQNTIVVMMSGSPIDMGSWIDRAPTVVQTWYAGMEGGRALAQVLFGDYNPSGRLPETFPISIEDVPAHKLGEYPGTETVHYKEGVFVGYRYYESKKVPVRFPFGYGLSYTKFHYDKLTLENVFAEDWMQSTVKVQIENTGDYDGTETVQVYVHANDSTIERPVKELRGFEKVQLKKGEKKEVDIVLHADAFTYFDTQMNAFCAEKGTYTIILGQNAHDEIMSTTVELPKNYLIQR